MLDDPLHKRCRAPAVVQSQFMQVPNLFRNIRHFIPIDIDRVDCRFRCRCSLGCRRIRIGRIEPNEGQLGDRRQRTSTRRCRNYPDPSAVNSSRTPSRPQGCRRELVAELFCQYYTLANMPRAMRLGIRTERLELSDRVSRLLATFAVAADRDRP